MGIAESNQMDIFADDKERHSFSLSRFPDIWQKYNNIFRTFQGCINYTMLIKTLQPS